MADFDTLEIKPDTAAIIVRGARGKELRRIVKALVERFRQEGNLAAMRGVGLIALPEDVSLQAVDERAMNDAGWYRKDKANAP